MAMLNKLGAGIMSRALMNIVLTPVMILNVP